MMNKKESTSKSKFATSSHKPMAKDLKEDDVEFEIDEYEFDAPLSSSECGCDCNKHSTHY